MRHPPHIPEALEVEGDAAAAPAFDREPQIRMRTVPIDLDGGGRHPAQRAGPSAQRELLAVLVEHRVAPACVATASACEPVARHAGREHEFQGLRVVVGVRGLVAAQHGEDLVAVLRQRPRGGCVAAAIAAARQAMPSMGSSSRAVAADRLPLRASVVTTMLATGTSASPAIIAGRRPARGRWWGACRRTGRGRGGGGGAGEKPPAGRP